MSCGCSNIDPCGKSFTTTTSTTTTTTVCPDAIECSEVIETSCVIYSGCDDECLQIKTGDSLETVFGNLFEAVGICPYSACFTDCCDQSLFKITNIPPSITLTVGNFCFIEANEGSVIKCAILSSFGDCGEAVPEYTYTSISESQDDPEQDCEQCLEAVGYCTTTTTSTSTTTTSTTTTSTTTTSTTTTTTSTTTTTTTEAPFSPDSISDLWAWYSSDEGVSEIFNSVTQWDDKTVGANHLSTYLTYNPELVSGNVGTLSTQFIRKPVSNTASMRTAVNFPDTTSSEVTIFAVLKMDSISGFGYDILLSGDDGIFITNLSGPNRILGRVGTNSPTFLSAAYTLGTWVTVRLGSNGTTQSLCINNSLLDSFNNISHLYLGGRPLRILANDAGNAADASFAEILIYTKALTPTEITNVETYLKNKYNHY